VTADQGDGVTAFHQGDTVHIEAEDFVHAAIEMAQRCMDERNAALAEVERLQKVLQELLAEP
jgi:hypothetical protein